MDKFCLNWSAFDANIRECFRQLRENQRLFDVTLVTDDGQHIQAHKIVLSAGSIFFNDLFRKSNHTDMLIYLKGISSDKLKPVIEFIYNGETFISQEELKFFIETGKELKVKGLEGMTGMGGNVKEERDLEDIKKFENIHGYTNSGDDLKESHIPDPLDNMKCDKTVMMDKENLQVRSIDEVGLKINAMIEKIEGVWECKVCGKTTPRNSSIRSHAERHIEGMCYPCSICSKTFPNRKCLSKHISNNHSALFSCDVCGKSGMNRLTYRDHKRRQHKPLLVFSN